MPEPTPHAAPSLFLDQALRHLVTARMAFTREKRFEEVPGHIVAAEECLEKLRKEMT